MAFDRRIYLVWIHAVFTDSVHSCTGSTSVGRSQTNKLNTGYVQAPKDLVLETVCGCLWNQNGIFAERNFAERIFRRIDFLPSDISPKKYFAEDFPEVLLVDFSWRRWYQNSSVTAQLFHIHYKKINMITHSNKKYKWTSQRTIDNVMRMRIFSDECSK